MSLRERLERLRKEMEATEQRAAEQKATEAVEATQERVAQTQATITRDETAVTAVDAEERHYQLKHAIYDAVMREFPNELPATEAHIAQARIKLDELIQRLLANMGILATRHERNMLIEEFINEIFGFGPIQQFLDDRSVTKIVVNSPKEVFIERLGVVERTTKQFKDDQHLLRIIEKIARLVGSRIDHKVPMLDRALPGGGRVRAKIPPLSAKGPTLTIDKGPDNPFVLLEQERQREQLRRTPLFTIRERVMERVMRELDQDVYALDQRERLTQLVEQFIDLEAQQQNVVLSRAERSQLHVEILNELTGYGPIEPLLHDPEVTEIMVNGPYQVYVERKGRLELTDIKFRDDEHVMRVIEKIVAPLGRRIDERSPMVDARLPDGSRVNAVIPPIALNGPCLTIRKFSRDPFTMTDLINLGTITPEAAQFLQAAVQAKLSIMVSGGTASGKTTTLNVLSSFISHDERIITIEDSAELQLRQEHVVRLEARPPNIEGEGEITIRQLVRNALRMRPDRIIVGEVRGPEALDMLQAMNTGHEGSMCTIHANSPREMLSRLETMVLMAGVDLPMRAIREQIASAIDIVVHQARMRDGSRKIVYITEIVGMEGDVITMQDLFVFEQEGIDEMGRVKGRLRATGLRPRCYDRIVAAGIRLPLTIFQR